MLLDPAAMALRTLTLVVMICSGCSSTDPEQQVFDGGALADPDADQADLYLPPGTKFDLGPPDTKPACWTAPVKCSFPCGPSKLCTAANNGACIPTLTLGGAAASTSVLAALTRAYVDCWFGYPGKTKACYALDTCQMTGSLNGSVVEGWICAAATASGLSSKYLSDAQKLLNCGKEKKPWGIKRPLWLVGAADPGEQGRLCLSYVHNGGWGKDRLHVKPCASSRP
jgi:hypothetical protein